VLSNDMVDGRANMSPSGRHSFVVSISRPHLLLCTLDSSLMYVYSFDYLCDVSKVHDVGTFLNRICCLYVSVIIVKIDPVICVSNHCLSAGISGAC